MSDIRRNLHDGSVDMFNSRGDWQVQLAKGAEMLKKLADSKIAWLSNQDQTDKNQLDKCLLEWMAISDQLGDILDRMTSVVNKFRRVSDRFQSLQDLSCLNSSFNSSVNQSRSSQDSHNFIGKTWDLPKFVEAAEKISDMYEAELKCKVAIVQTLPLCQSHADFTTCSAGWIHQPYICDRTIDSSLNALLYESEL